MINIAEPEKNDQSEKFRTISEMVYRCYDCVVASLPIMKLSTAKERRNLLPARNRSGFQSNLAEEGQPFADCV